MNPPSVQELPRSLYALLAGVAALIGLASSVVTTKFFILGMDLIEPDTFAREALTTAAVLMVITELAVFGLAALLPRSALRSSRFYLMVCGVALLSFETVTIYVTQVSLAQNSAAAAQGGLTKITALRAAIASNQLAADSLRDNGSAQSLSPNSWTRQMGAAALRDSLATTRLSQPLVQELAQLESEQRSTLVDILGYRGMILYSVARALLISAMGLVMFGTAGALLRLALNKSDHRPAAPSSTSSEAGVPARRTYALQSLVQQKHVDYSFQHPLWITSPIGAGRTPAGDATLPVSRETHEHTPSTQGFAPSTQDCASSTLSTDSAEEDESQATPKHTAGALASTQSTFCEPASALDVYTAVEADERFRHLVGEITSGQIKPSVRSLQSHLGIGTLLARKYLRQLESIGVITAFGKGWNLKTDSNL